MPRNAIVDVEGKRGVFLAADSRAHFRPVETGLQEAELVEVVAGLSDGEKVVTTGAAGLKDGDTIVLAGQPGGGRPGQGRPGGGPQGARQPGRPRGQPGRPLTDWDCGYRIRIGMEFGISSMSIPRTAIHRPVTMFMICAVIVLLGAISLTRLPIDLLPEITYPSITIRVGYTGVGPLEMEELSRGRSSRRCPPWPASSGSAPPRRRASSNVRLNFAWGTDLNEAADDVRSRIDRVKGRLPEEADVPTIFKFDSTAMPIMSIGVEGDYDRVTLREIAERELSPRMERVPGVASVTASGGLRRQIHVLLSKEKIAALDLSVDRIITPAAARRTRTRRSGWWTKAT